MGGKASYTKQYHSINKGYSALTGILFLFFVLSIKSAVGLFWINASTAFPIYNGQSTILTAPPTGAADSIAGPDTVCRLVSTGVVYSTPVIPGADSYIWTVPPGAVITSGQGTDSITVNYPAGSISGSMTVTGFEGGVPGAPATLAITIMGPTLTGPESVCIGSAGNTYTTEAGKTAYDWTACFGCTITAGGDGSNFVTVTWTSAGNRFIKVTYTDGSCTTLDSLPVTVYPVQPGIFGPNSLCSGATGTFSTESGMWVYTWMVSPGGTITSGEGTNTVTAIWTGTGPQTISCLYTNPAGCTASDPTFFVVTVNPPTPIITGPNTVCEKSTGNVYTAQPGMANYVWNISPGGTITAGGTPTSNTVTVTWDTEGAKTVSVSYTDANGCIAPSPTVYNVTVNPTTTESETHVDVTYHGGNNGSIDLTVNGGTGVHTCYWTAVGGGVVPIDQVNHEDLMFLVAGTYTVVVTDANSCAETLSVIIDQPDALIVNPTSNSPVCLGSTLNLLSNASGGTLPYTYDWTGPNGFTSTNQDPSISNVTLADSGWYTVTVMDFIGMQATSSTHVTVLGPTLTGPTPVCQGSTGNVYTTEPGMSNYIWVVNGGTYTGGSTTDNTVTVTWTIAGAGSVEVTYTDGTCTASASFPVTVDPTPNAIATPSSQTVCSATAITTIVLTGGVTGTVFNWTRDNTVTVTGIAGSGSGDISGTLINSTNAPITVTFTITPTANGCPGAPITATVLVNPTPNAVATPSAQTICSATAITTIVLTGGVTGTVFDWTRDNTVAVTGIPANGSGNISGMLTNTTNAPVTVTFTITPTANGCPGAPITATVLVNPTPNAVATPSAQTICSATAITTIVLTGGITGTIFDWTRDNTVAVTGIAASGSGNISGTLTNTTNAPVTVTFTITPTANGCQGAPITATVLVNPTPNAVATPSSQTICSATAITTIVLTGGVTGTFFDWTRDNTATVTGIPASGIGNISGTLTNTMNAPVTVTFTITPTANGCPGAPITATVLVNPTPNAVATPSAQAICSATAITTIVLTGGVTGTIFDWTRDNTVAVTGIPASGIGNISGTLTNTTNAFVTVTFTITPTANGCPGAPITATVLVNPTPNAVATPSSQTICSATAITTIVLTGGVTGTVFDWTRDNTVAVTGIPANGSGNISGTLINTTNAPVTVTFTITPTANGCPGAPITATVLVNPTPNAIATPSVQTICSSTAITTIVLTGGVTGTVFDWTRDNTATVTGIPANGIGNISGTLTNTTNAPVTVTFTITPTANGCTGAPITATVLVNPTPNAVATPSSQTICSATTITTIVLTGGVTGTIFDWARDNTVAVTGIPANGSGNISGTLTNTTNAPVTVTFTITPTANGCPGAPITATVLVNPTPNAVATPAAQTICSATAITTIVLTGGVTGTVFDWTRDNTVTVTGIAVSGSGNISGTLTNTTNAPVTVAFTITPTANGCPGAPITATVLVNPTPNAVATPSAQTICSATAITTIVLTGGVTGTIFDWTRDNTVTVTGIAASGSGNISGTLTNTTNAPVTVTFTITPTANGCPGAPITATILVNPTPNAVATPSSQTICSATAITTIVLTGGVTGTIFDWTRDNTATVTGIPANGIGNISGTLTNTTNAPVTVTFTITPTANGCPGAPITSTVLVNPTPNAVATPSSQTICSATAITTIVLTGSVTGTVFNWTRDNTVTVTGIAANGSGNISGTLTNTTNAPVTVTFTITPTANGCPGAPITATVLVNPTPNAIATPAAQTICSATAITTIVLTGGVTGTIFDWTRDNTVAVTGIPASGIGNISGTLTNTTNAPVTVTFTITPTANGCPGAPITATVLVNPTPNAVATPAAQTICSATAITTIVLTGGVTGTIFDWTRDNTVAVTGIPASGSGNISGTLTNTTNAPVTVTFTITPTANGCPGAPITATVLVNPTPNAIATPSAQTICSATAITTIVLTGGVTGTVFDWTRDNTATVTGIPASGIGNINGTLTNTTNVPVTVTFTITPTANGCPGAPITATVLVNPTPNAVATPSAQTICSATAITTIVLTGGVTGTVFDWTRDNTATVTGIPANGIGNISGTLTNTTNAPVTVTFTITPTANGCTGAPITATVLVNPTPNAVATPASQTICSASTITTIVLTGNIIGTTFNWTRDNTITVTGIAGSGSGDISGTLSNTTNAPVTVTFTIIPTANGCPGALITATVLVNPTPNAVATPASQTICSASTITTIVLTGNTSGTTFNWTRDNTVTVTGIAGSGSGDIIGALTNTTSAPITVTFIITPTANGCPGAPITATVLVNPTPNAVALPASQTICSASTITTIVLSGNTTGTTFNWTRDNTVAVTGIPANGSGNISGTLTNTTNAPVTVTFTITPTANGCPGAPITATVLVNPTPNAVATPSSQTICSATAITTIVLTGGVTGTVFDWTRDNTATVTGIPASGIGNISGTLTNTTNVPVTVTFTITPTANGCPGTPITATVLVNPTPNAIATPSSQTICSATAITTIVLTGGVTGTIFDWTRDNTVTVTGIPASGIGNISGTLTNTTNVPVTVTFTITPTANGCPGAPITATVLVNPTPNAVATPSSQTICSATAITTIVLTGGVTGTIFDWTRDNTVAVTGIPANGSGNISGTLTNTTNAPVTVTFTITPTANGCPGAPITATVLVNPTPNAVATPSAQTICSATAITTIVLTGGVTGTIFDWTRDNTVAVTGIPASGSGNISGTLTNTTNAPVTVTFTITPTANGCPGAPITATVLVNPTPNAVATPSSQTICSATAITTIVLTGGVTGTVFDWTRDNTVAVTGIPASGIGNISGTLTNTTNAPVTVTFTITPTANGCPGAPITATVLVNPTPNAVATPSAQTICSATAITTIVLTGGVTGTIFDWTRDNTVAVTGIPASGIGNISGTLTNTTNAPVTVTFTITPTANGCPGAPITATVLVNPTPNAVATPSAQTICSATAITTIVLTGSVTGTVFDWTRDNTATVTGIPASGSGNISGTLTNTTNAPVTVTFTITPTANGCPGAPITATVLVNPTPNAVATPSSQTICSATAITTIVLTGSVTGTIFDWTRDNTATVTGIPASGIGNISGTLTNTTNAPVTVTFTITPTANGCPGAPITATVLVNPTPNAIATPSAQTICSATAITTIVLTGGVTGTIFDWTRDNTVAVTGIPASGIGNISGTLTNTTNAPVTVTFTITPTANGCPGAPITATVLVNPTPNAVATPSSQTICSATTITTIVLTGGVTGTVFDWTRDNTVAVTGIPANGSGNISGTLTNTTNAPVTVTFTITPTANGCPGAPITATVLVNPTPNAIATPSSQTICSTGTTNIALSSATAGTTFSWTIAIAPVGSVTGASASNGNTIAQTLTNITANPATVTYTVTPIANGCVGLPIIVVVTVNPTPNAVATPASQTICSASTITTIVLTGNTSGTTYNWTRDNTVTVTGIPANGSGNISGTLTNTTNAPVTVTFTITPTANGCAGTPITATVLVNPTPNAIATPSAQTICSATAITTIVLTGSVTGTTYAWTRDNTVAVTGIAANGNGNISGTLTNTTNAPVTVTFTITPSANGCAGAPITATVLVNPTPNAVATPPSQTICSSTPITTIVFTGNVTGTVFNWTRDNTVAVTGIAASGSGNISGTLTNTTNAPVTVTFTITPTANGCPGAPITATVLVNPTPNAVATPSAQTICSATAITTIVLTGGVTGTVFNWTRNNTVTVTGIAASGSGNISGTLTNTTNAPVTVTFTITPTANSCPGAPITATVLVNPTPNAVATPSSQTVCSATAITTIVLSGSVAGTTYSWTRDNTVTVTGIANNGSGNISGTLTNKTNAPITVTFTITPSANGCSGTPITATVIVNPTPVIPSPQNVTICSGGTFIVSPSNNPPGTIVPAGTTYTWTAPVINPVGSITGGSAQGTGQASISQTLTNITNQQATATYTVTPKSGAAGACVGVNFQVQVTVNPKPVIPDQTATICSGNTFTVSPVNNPPTTIVPNGTSYTWPAPIVTGGITGGSAQNNKSSISQTLTNPTNVVQTATYTVTPTSGAQGNCPGANFTVTVTVNPTPVIPDQTATICSGLSFTVSPVNGIPSATTIVPINTTYTWPAPAVTGGITGGSAQSGQPIISQTLTNPTNVVQTATYTVTPTSGAPGACPGANFQVVVTVNPKPVGSAFSQTLCSGETTSDTLHSTVPGTSYTWTAAQIIPVSPIIITGFNSCPGPCNDTIKDVLVNTTITDPAIPGSGTVGVVQYTVTPTSSNGCVGQPFVVNDTVNPHPPSYNISFYQLTDINEFTTCDGGTVYGQNDLDVFPQPVANFFNGYNVEWQYAFSPGGPWNAAPGSWGTNYQWIMPPPPSIFSPLGDYYFRFVVTNSYGCSGPSDVIVLHVISTINVEAGGPHVFCPNATPPYILLSGATVSGTSTTPKGGTWSISSLAPPNGGINGTLTTTNFTTQPDTVHYTPPAGYVGTIKLLLTSNDPDGAGPCLPLHDTCKVIIFTSGPFQSCLAPTNWPVINTNADGYLDGSNAPCQVTLYGGDNQSGTPGTTDMSHCSGAGNFKFDWYFLAPPDIIGFPVWHLPDQQVLAGNNGAAVIINKPTNLSAGDLIIVMLHFQNTPNTITPPAGFTLIRNEKSGVWKDARTAVASYYKIATGAEPANYNFGTPATTKWYAVAGRVTGYNTSNPIGDQSGVNSGLIKVFSQVLPSVNIVTANSLLVAGLTIRNNPTVVTTPAGMTNIYGVNSGSFLTKGADQTIPAPGATGTRTFSWTSRSGTAAAQMFVINPVPTVIGDDAAYYLINGVPTLLANSNSSGSVSVAVANGTTVGFRAGTNSNKGGRGALTIYNLVVPNITPVITCPVNKTVNCDESTLPGNTGTATATNNCGLAIVITYRDVDVPGNCPGNHVITRIWKAVNSCGDSSTCNQIITVHDITAPVIIAGTAGTSVCQGPNPNLNTNYMTWLANHGGATATDNCSAVTWTNNAATATWSGGCINTITIIFTATDACGNPATTTNTFTITDSQPPVIIAGTAGTSGCQGPNPNLNANYVAWLANHGGATATDLCGSAITWTNNAATATWSGGCINTITIIFTATDACGNPATTTNTFTITDSQPPVIIAGTAGTSGCQGPNPNLNANYVAWLANHGGATATDLCGSAITWTNNAATATWSGGCINTITIIFTATDACGNPATTTNTFTITDSQPPVIIAGTAGTSECQGLNPSLNTDYLAWLANHGGATATDLCGNVIIWTNNAATATWSGGCINTITIIFTATDACNNAATTTNTFTISDTQAPVITSCPTTITVPPDPGQTYATVSLPAPVYSDNCTAFANISITWTMTAPTAGSGINIIPAPFQFNVGTTTVIYTFTDACGNVSTCTFNVIVTPNVPPDITCPADINQPADLNLCSAALSPGFPTLVSGTVPVTYTWVMTGATTGSGTGAITPDPFTFNVGITTITWTATNIAGSDVCTQTITVTDNQPPTITCPPIVTYSCASLVPAHATDYTSFIAAGGSVSDNCPGAITVVWVDDVISNQTCANRYTLTRTYRATDVTGNQATCSQVITVNDITAPVIGCPADQFFCEVPSNIYTIPVLTASDNCGGAITITFQITGATTRSGSGNDASGIFNAGISIITWTVKDVCDNTSTCTTNITVDPLPSTTAIYHY